MRRTVSFAFAIAIVIAIIGTGSAFANPPAPPFTTNAQCLQCHARSGPYHDPSYVLDSGTTTFTVGAVDFSTACAKCHWAGSPTAPTSSMPYQTTSHNYSSSSACSGSGCHTAPFASVNGMAIPRSLVASMGSYFNSATSYQVDSETLHRIHSNTRWPADADIIAGGLIPGQAPTKKALYSLRCAGCHAAASCVDCHAGAAVSPEHAAHTTATVTSAVGEGTVIGDQSAATTQTLAQTCSTANCHVASAIVGGTYFDSAASNTVKVGVWALGSGGQFFCGSALKSNSTTASVSASVSGARFSVFGYTLSGGGSAIITVDSSVVATVSCYSAAQSGSTELYRGNLSAGSHTITISNTGVAGKGAGKFITFDCIAVYPTSYAAFKTHDCVDCHVLPTQSSHGIDAKDRRIAHGYDTTQHAGAQATEVDGVFGQTCSSCHEMDMMVVHDTQMRHGQPSGCDVCHRVIAGNTMTAADWVRGSGAWDTGGLAHKCQACHGNPAAATSVPSLVSSVKHYRYGTDVYKPITLISGDVATWKHSPATFSLEATDEAFGSGVASTHYRLDGGADTLYSAPVSVSKEGTTVVTFWSVDTSGNIETTNTAYVLVDDHAPVVVGTPTTPANSAGWYKSDVTVHFTATDALSGVAAVSPDVTLSEESAGLSASGSATDVAGNRGTTTLSDIRIDKTPPVTTCDATNTYTGTATVTFAPTDNVSGAAHTYYTFDGGATVHEGASCVTTRAGQYDLGYWSVDAAGNVESRHYVTYMLWPLNAVFTRNAQCLGCHSRSGASHVVSDSFTVTFTAGAVDRSTACQRCHWVGDPSAPAASHPYTTVSHAYANANCAGTGCHSAPYGTLNGMAVPHSYVASMSSYFYSSASCNVDAETLHRIHENSRWPASVDITAGGAIPGQPSRKALYDLRCPSCHSAVACSACHGTVEHSQHATGTAAVRTGAGTPPGDQGSLSTTESLRCALGNCHPLAQVGSGTVYDSAGTAITKTGAWTAVTGVTYESGSAIKSNANPGAVSFTVSNVASGSEFCLFAFTLPTGGSALVKVDGSTVATIGFYSATQSGGKEMYRGSFKTGDHTVSLVNSQIAGKGGGKFITMDDFAVYLTPYVTPDGAFRGSCGAWACHIADVVASHEGDLDAAHSVDSSASLGCVGCHPPADVRTIHAGRSEGGCVVCHGNPVRGDLAAGKASADCAGCHVTEGTDFHRGETVAHSSTTSQACFAAGCHDVSRSLPAVHALFAGTGARFSGYATSCALCHLNTDPARIDWNSPTSACSGCHPAAPHSREATGHSITAASVECTGCHAGDLPGIHGAADESSRCAVCHAGKANWSKTADCPSCHSGKSPVATNHYAGASHTASNTPGCDLCHSLGLAPEHAKPSSGSLTCLGCHLSSRFAALDGSWSGSCDACHSDRHASQTAAHSVPASDSACFGERCHSGSDISLIHSKATTIVAGVVETSCAVCHAAGVPASAECGGCHDLTIPHGDLAPIHRVDLGLLRTLIYSYTMRPWDEYRGYTAVGGEYCSTCHTITDVAAQHGNDCAICHSGATDSLGVWSRTCQQGACHPSIHGNEDSAHYSIGHGMGGCDGCHHMYQYWDLNTGDFNHAYACTTCHGGTSPSVASTSDVQPLYMGNASIVITASVGGPQTPFGTAFVYYRIDGGTLIRIDNAGGAPTQRAVVTIPQPLLGSEAHTIEYWAVDAGAREESSHHAALFTIDHDTRPPVTTCGALAAYPPWANAAFLLEATDQPWNGAITTYYDLDGQGAVAFRPPVGLDVRHPAHGTVMHDLEYWSSDAQGNVETHRWAHFTLSGDDTAPVTGANIPPYQTTNNFTFTLAATDGESGVGATSWRIDGRTAQVGLWVWNDRSWPEGTNTVEYWSSDNAGNVEAHHVATFTVDTGAPVTTFAVQALASSCATVALTATDTVSGLAGTYYELDGGAQTTGTVVRVGTAGHHSIDYWSVDMAGNREATKTAGFTVSADAVPPTTLALGVRSYYPGGAAATMSLVATDDPGGTGVSATYFTVDGGARNAGTAIAVYGDGTHTVGYWSEDYAGNVETSHSVTFVIGDHVAPATVSDVVSDYKGDAHIALTATDGPSSSGVAHTYFCVDSGQWREGTAVTVPTTTMGSAYTNHWMWFYSVDAAGNAETYHYVTFRTWGVTPVTTCDVRPFYGGLAVIDLIATDVGGPGVGQTLWGVDMYPGIPGNHIVVTAPGPHTLRFYTMDVNGWAEAMHTVTFTVDAAAPVTTSDAGPYYIGSAAISLTATDGADGSGVAATCYRLDEGAVTTATAVAVPSAGEHVLWFWSVDDVGNVEVPRVATFTVAAVGSPPMTTTDVRSLYTTTAAITLTAWDSGGPGVAATHYRLDGGATTTGTTLAVSSDGTHALEFWSVDALGHTESPRHADFIVDTVPPTTTSDAVAHYAGEGAVTLTATDNPGGSGVANTYFTCNGNGPFEGNVVTFSGYGPCDISFWSVDVAGNVEAPKTVTVTIDDVTPPITYCSAMWMAPYVGNATITLYPTDEGGGSGIAATHYILDGGDEQTGEELVVDAPSSGCVTHDLVYWSEDNAGNVEQQNDVSFTVFAPPETPKIRFHIEDVVFSGYPCPLAWAQPYEVTVRNTFGSVVTTAAGVFDFATPDATTNASVDVPLVATPPLGDPIAPFSVDMIVRDLSPGAVPGGIENFHWEGVWAGATLSATSQDTPNYGIWMSYHQTPGAVYDPSLCGVCHRVGGSAPPLP